VATECFGWRSSHLHVTWELEQDLAALHAIGHHATDQGETEDGNTAEK